MHPGRLEGVLDSGDTVRHVDRRADRIVAVLELHLSGGIGRGEIRGQRHRHPGLGGRRGPSTPWWSGHREPVGRSRSPVSLSPSIRGSRVTVNAAEMELISGVGEGVTELRLPVRHGDQRADVGVAVLELHLSGGIDRGEIGGQRHPSRFRAWEAPASRSSSARRSTDGHGWGARRVSAKPEPEVKVAVMLRLPAVVKALLHRRRAVRHRHRDPTFVPLSLNCTVPTAFDVVTVADNVTAVPSEPSTAPTTVPSTSERPPKPIVGAESDGFAFAVPRYFACNGCVPAVVGVHASVAHRKHSGFRFPPWSCRRRSRPHHPCAPPVTVAVRVTDWPRRHRSRYGRQCRRGGVLGDGDRRSLVRIRAAAE